MTTPSKRTLPLESKKFLAFLIGELTWKAVLVVALVVFHKDFAGVGAWAWWFMISVVVTAGFTEVGYIGGQAWLDKYVRVAEIARNAKNENDSDTD
jgi:hypothetical protein